MVESAVWFMLKSIVKWFRGVVNVVWERLMDLILSDTEGIVRGNRNGNGNKDIFYIELEPKNTHT
jgi:hypothetical protein